MKINETGNLFPGVISVRPFEKVYVATYGAESLDFETYEHAKQWIMSKKMPKSKVSLREEPHNVATIEEERQERRKVDNSPLTSGWQDNKNFWSGAK